MDQSLTSWMISGGGRLETRDDQRHRAHVMAIRESAAAERTGTSVRDLIARWVGRSPATSSAALTTDCCAA